MKTVRQYLSGCTWCGAMGYVSSRTPHPEVSYSTTEPCPVCNGSKVIMVTETIETDEPEKYEPYFGWCDVKGCKNEGSGGGIGWRDTGYWTLCMDHHRMEREGKKQPKMKPEAIERESRRDKKTGWLIKGK